MKPASVGAGGIVHQALTKDNYERWKGVMQNYLEGHGLWEAVEEKAAEVQTDQDNNLKKTKDPKANLNLHVFQVSRGREILETIKKSWNHLNPQNGTDQSKIIPDIEQGKT